MAQAIMVAPQAVAKIDEPHKKNRIQVSNTKKPLFFYLNLAKRYIKQHNDVELSALGLAIPTVVTIAEILKANGVAVEKKVLTSTVGSKDENKGRLVQKAKLEIVLEKNEKPGNQKPSAQTEGDKQNPEATKSKNPETEPKAEEAKAAEGTATSTEKPSADAEKNEG